MNDYCTDGLKTRLIAIPTYESTIRDDPLALLTAIKTCVHDNACTKYPPVTISTHWDRLLKLKQAEDEDPSSYAKRFEQQLKTVKGYIGSTFTDGFADQMPEYKAHAYKHDAGKITVLLCLPHMWPMKLLASPWPTILLICSAITNLRRLRTNWISKLRLDLNLRPTSSYGLSPKPSMAHS